MPRRDGEAVVLGFQERMGEMARAFVIALLLVACGGVAEQEPVASDAGVQAEPDAEPCKSGEQVGTVKEAAGEDCARLPNRKGEPARWCCFTTK